MHNLLERAKNHSTAQQGREILGESFEALKRGDITAKKSNKISSIIGKRVKSEKERFTKTGKSKYIRG